MQTLPMRPETSSNFGRSHFRGSAEDLTASFDVAIIVKSFTRESKISVHVGKSNLNAMMEMKKKPRMSKDDARR